MFVRYKNHIINIVMVVKGWEQRQSHINKTAMARFTQYWTVRPDTQVKELSIQTKKKYSLEQTVPWLAVVLLHSVANSGMNIKLIVLEHWKLQYRDGLERVVVLGNNQ